MCKLGLIAALLLTLSCTRDQPKDLEISALITAFESSGLSLERNGEQLHNAEASQWLRRKLTARSSDVRSPEDFIRRVADHSSETKKPYLIILSDGTKELSAEWFNAKLKEMRSR